MKAKLVGKQFLDFVPEGKTEADRIKGVKLHVVSDFSETTPSMQGQRVADIFTRLDCGALKVGGMIDLTYEQSLGSTKARLVSVANV